MLESDGRPYRFASLNAPELLTGHEWEAEDTMRTLRAFGRPVTRTYTLTIKGTSPFFGSGEHISGWDAERQDWIFNEASFKKVSFERGGRPERLTKKVKQRRRIPCRP